MEKFLQLAIALAALAYVAKIVDEINTKVQSKRNNRRMQQELAEMARLRDEEAKAQAKAVEKASKTKKK